MNLCAGRRQSGRVAGRREETPAMMAKMAEGGTEESRGGGARTAEAWVGTSSESAAGGEGRRRGRRSAAASGTHEREAGAGRVSVRA
jgi:hypothetical protein